MINNFFYALNEFLRDNTFIVIGNDDRSYFIDPGPNIVQNLVDAYRRNRFPVFLVKPHHLLSVSHDSRFQCRRTVFFNHNALRFNLTIIQLGQQLFADRIGPDNSRNVRPASHGMDVVEHIRATAEQNVVFLNVNDGDRSFRRNTRHIPPDEMIDHDIANHQNARAGETGDDFQRSLFCQ
jgi:hypothetical protein